MRKLRVLLQPRTSLLHRDRTYYLDPVPPPAPTPALSPIEASPLEGQAKILIFQAVARAPHVLSPLMILNPLVQLFRYFPRTGHLVTEY